MQNNGHKRKANESISYTQEKRDRRSTGLGSAAITDKNSGQDGNLVCLKSINICNKQLDKVKVRNIMTALIAGHILLRIGLVKNGQHLTHKLQL